MKKQMYDKNNGSEVLAYSINEAMRVTGLGRSKIYGLINEGKLDVRKIGRRTIIPAASLRDLIDGAQAA